MFKKVIVTLIVISLSISYAYSQGSVSGSEFDYLGRGYLNTVQTAVPFLLIAPDSRAGAMGDVGAATSADAASQHHNPAKNVFNENKFGISVSYSPWLKQLINDIHLLYLGMYLKPTDKDAIAFSLRYFSLGEITFTNDEGGFMSYQKPNEFAIDLSYSRKLIDELSIALTPKFIYSDLTARQYSGNVETKAGIAGAADLSLFYEQDFRSRKMHNQTLRAGLNISNIGNKMSYSDGTQKRDFISTNLKLGVGYTMEFDPYNKLAVTGELNKLLVPTPCVYQTDSNGKAVYDDANNRIIKAGRDPNVGVPLGMIQSFYDAPGGFKEEMSEFIWAIGIEYAYRDLLFVRAGYFNESKNKGNRKFFTVGAGIQYNIIGIDVAYLFTINQHHPLENTLRFTLTFDFASFNSTEIKNQRKVR